MSATRSFTRILRFTAQNILRNLWLSLVTLSVFFLTLVTVNVVLFVNVLADVTLKNIEQKVEVAIYFEPETSEEILLAAQGYAQGLTQVRETRVITSEDALLDFTKRHENDPVILASLEEVSGNPFGPSLIISANSTEDFAFIVDAMDTPEFTEFIKEKGYDDRAETIANIRTWSSRIRLAGLILAGFFTFIAISIIFNTIRVAIYVHREEIGIMKLVGANDWFVRGPFLFEALFYTACASLLVTVGTIGVLKTIEPRLAFFFSDANIGVYDYFTVNAPWIFGAEFIGLLVLSLMTTWLAMRRYLRV